jgi:hypothetical protein
VGDPWTVADVPISSDGLFTADLGTQPVPVEAFPILNDPFLTLVELALTGATTSADGFCGYITGYAQVFAIAPSDRVRVEGSTVGAVRITGDTLPLPVASCPAP